MEKIKGIDKKPVYLILTIVLVAVGSFYLGKMSNSTQSNENVNIVNSKGGRVAGDYKPKDGIISNKPPLQIEGLEAKYVASKNGKLYYRIGCGSSSRIKDENKVFFESANEAESAGFQASASCTP